MKKIEIWSRAHLKKTREISIFLGGGLFRRTIFFEPVVLDVFLDGASIESIKFTKKSHHGLLKCEKTRKTAFFGHFRPIFTFIGLFSKSAPTILFKHLACLEEVTTYMLTYPL